MSERAWTELIEARIARGLTQQQLGALAHIQPSVISHYESGNRKPSADNLLRLAEALEVSTDYLVGRRDGFPPTVSAYDAFQALDFINDTYDGDAEREFDTIRAYIRQSEKRLIAPDEKLHQLNNSVEKKEVK